MQERYPNYPINPNVVSDIKERLCYVATSTDSTNTPKSYECPDRQYVTIEKEQWQCPEVLFNPSLIGINSPGIHELCYQAIMKCDEEIHMLIFWCQEGILCSQE